MGVSHDLRAPPPGFGKVGLVGCSSTAEWQMAVASLGNPALAAMNPQGFGAGVGRVDGWHEQGNWYRGDPAAAEARKALEVNPDFSWDIMMIGLLYGTLGDERGARGHDPRGR